jgi:hypothetical protein
MLDEKQREALRWQLTMLHELLEDTEKVDGETKRSMHEVSSELNRILEQEAGHKSEADHWDKAKVKWQDAVIDFESHHPRLALTVEEITGLLARMGL